MPLARNDEITTLSSIARDDNIIIAQVVRSARHKGRYLPDIAVIAQSIGIFL